MSNLETLPLITALIALISTTLMGVLKHFSETVKDWPPLAKQVFVLVLSGIMIAGLHIFDLTVVPDIYRGALVAVIQAAVAGLAGIGMHNVKKGMTDSTGSSNYPE